MASQRFKYLHHQFSGFHNSVSFLIPYDYTRWRYARIWDVENKRKQKTVIVVKSKERGTRTKVTTCAYSHDARYIGDGLSISSCFRLRLTNCVCLVCLDGVMHMWKTTSNFARPDMSIEGAHRKGTETGSIVFSVDGRTVLTRGGDDTVKRKY